MTLSRGRTNHCEYGHATQGEIRRFPIGGGATLDICRECYRREDRPALPWEALERVHTATGWWGRVELERGDPPPPQSSRAHGTRPRR